MSNKRLSYVLGALFIAFGVLFILSPSGVFESIVVFAGAALIIFSVFGVVSSLFGKSISSYYLGSSLLGLIFGILLVTNTSSAVKIIPVLLGIYLFISGLTTTLMMSKVGSSLTSMVSPITRLILGLICFSFPIIPISIFGVFIGIVFILSGINTITNTKSEEVVYKVKVKK